MIVLLCRVLKYLRVLPRYITPVALQENHYEMAGILRQYVAQGYSNAEILGLLGIVHGFAIGMRTLKWWLNVLKLKRHKRANEAPL